MIKRLLMPCTVLLLFIGSVSAEIAAEVSLRYGRQENAVRIVLEARDELIRNASTITSLTSVRIDFPAAVQIRKPTDFPYETVLKDRFFAISLRDVVDIKTYKLTTPSRIVIDLKTAPKPDTRASQEAQTPTQKGQKEKVSPDASKAPATSGHAVQPKPQQPAGPSAAAPPAAATEKARKLKLLVIDPGHGGYDQGIVRPEVREKDLSLVLAKELSAALAKKGLTVFLTRKTDQPLSLQERINFASSKRPDLFISLHASAADRWSVYTSAADETSADTAVRMYSQTFKQGRHLEKSRAVAKVLATAIRREFKGTVAFRELSLPLLTSLDAPAVIIEYPLAGNSPNDQKMRERIIKTLLSGVASYEQ